MHRASSDPISPSSKTFAISISARSLPLLWPCPIAHCDLGPSSLSLGRFKCKENIVCALRSKIARQYLRGFKDRHRKHFNQNTHMGAVAVR